MTEQVTLFPPQFNRSIRIEARPERLSAEPGALILREAAERLGIIDWLVPRLHDLRRQDLITHPLGELLRTELLCFAQGWRDDDDADALRDDPAMRLAVSNRRGTSPLDTRPDEERWRDHNPEVPDGLASQPTLSRLARALSDSQNRSVLRAALLEMAARRIRAGNRQRRLRSITVDIDSLPIEVHGHQPGSAYNGHYHQRIYHPLIASIAETGDLIDAILRKGAVHTADGAPDFVVPLLDEAEHKLCCKAAVRMDAGFPEENILGALEQRRTPYVARVRNNPVLDRMAEPFLRRPVGRRTAEPREWFYEMSYQAESWSRPRRVVLVVQERVGELYLHHFWLITNRTVQQMSGQELCEEYRQRGTAEGHMGELMDVLDPALSSSPRPKTHYQGRPIEFNLPSCDSFAVNEVLLLLNVLAYNIMHAARVLMESATKEGWSIRRLRERVLRVAARVLVHGRRTTVVISRAASYWWQLLWCELAFFR